MNKETIFLLDSEPAKEFKERHEELSSVKVEIFSDAKEMKLRLSDDSKVKPSIILVDLYSTDSSAKATKSAIKELELELEKFGELRRNLSRKTGDIWEKSGMQRVKDTLRLLKKLELDRDIPVAIASRYGRRLLDGPDIRYISRSNVYWCWKNRDMTKSLKDEGNDTLSEEEIYQNARASAKTERDCMNEIIGFFGDDMESLKKLNQLKAEIENSKCELILADERYEAKLNSIRAVRNACIIMVIFLSVLVVLQPHINKLQDLAREVGFSGSVDINTLLSLSGVFASLIPAVIAHWYTARKTETMMHNKLLKSDS